MMWYWVADMVVPTFGALFGNWLKKHPPRYGKSRWGYRSKRSQESAESWAYAHRRIGEMWVQVSLILIIAVVLNRLYSTLDPIYVTAIDIAAGIACLLAVLPVVEHELKRRSEAKQQESDSKS